MNTNYQKHKQTYWTKKKKHEKYSDIDAGGPEKPLIYFVWPYIDNI